MLTMIGMFLLIPLWILLFLNALFVRTKMQLHKKLRHYEIPTDDNHTSLSNLCNLDTIVG